MALTAHLTKTDSHKSISRSAPFVVFETDAYYCYLSRRFEEIHQRTGKMVHPYDGAVFHAYELSVLEDVFSLAQEQVTNEPEVISVKVGTQIAPEKQELFEELNRNVFSDFLVSLCALIRRAEAEGKYVYFYGD